ncbi:MAG: biotin/lipoyl-containing protein, partial [Thermoanaerobaculia bacterium]
MAEIIMPKMGDAMTEGKVLRWYKKTGEPVKKGEPLLEIETDKVNLDLEAEQDGTLGNLAAQEGQTVPVGSVLASILGAGEKDSPAATQKQKAEEPVQRRATDKKDSVKHTTGEYGEAIEMRGPRIDRTSPQGNVIAMPKGNGGRRRSSPLARKMASELGVSLDSLQGSGPGGRIIAKDVQG